MASGGLGGYSKAGESIVENCDGYGNRIDRFLAGAFRAVLDRIDRYIDAAGFADTTPDPDRPEPIRTDSGPRELDLRRAGITTVVWATGYRRDYSWLRVGVLDGHGEIEQRGGVTAAPGLYVIGLRFQTRRNSNFIDGVGHDARAIAAHIVHRTAATEVPAGVPTPVAV